MNLKEAYTQGIWEEEEDGFWTRLFPEDAPLETTYFTINDQENGSFLWEIGEAGPGGRVLAGGESDSWNDATKKVHALFNKLVDEDQIGHGYMDHLGGD